MFDEVVQFVVVQVLLLLIDWCGVIGVVVVVYELLVVCCLWGSFGWVGVVWFEGGIVGQQCGGCQCDQVYGGEGRRSFVYVDY